MRRVVLSHPLPVLGLVSRYLTNYLIGRSPLSRRQAFDLSITSGITQSFPWLSPTSRYVGTHYSPFRRSTRGLLHFRARLACFSHAASVQSEPGSNSSIDCLLPRPKTRERSKKRGALATAHAAGSERERSVTPVQRSGASGRLTRWIVLEHPAIPTLGLRLVGADTILVELMVSGITRMFDRSSGCETQDR